MRTQSVVFEELITVYQAAGIAQGDNMEGDANPKTFAPSWAKGVEVVVAGFASNGDALGQTGGLGTVSGPAFPDGPHEIVLGCHGGENVDLTHQGMKGEPLVDMGMRVKGGLSYRVQFMAEGDADAEEGCSLELVFQDAPVRQPKHWEYSGVVTATVDTDLQGRDSTQTTTSISPGDSTEIGGAIGAMGCDAAALGLQGNVCKLSKGVEDDQEILLGVSGGELNVGSGHLNAPTQRHHVSYKVKAKTNVYVAFRGIFEAGVSLGMISLGFVVR